MNPFGPIINPLKQVNPDINPNYLDVTGGLPALISNIIRLIVVGAGIFAMINIIIAGITYIGSSGDEAKIKQAAAMINMSLIGLVIIAASLVITGIISYLLFQDASVILKPTIYGPGSISTPPAGP